MKIAVCIKRVPDMELRFAIASDRKSLEQSGLKYDMSDFDGYALELALRLHPSTEQVLVVAKSVVRKNVESMTRSALEPFSGRVRLTYLDEDTVPGLIAAVKAAPPRSLVLFVAYAVNEPANAADWSVQSDLHTGSVQYGDRAFTVTVPAGLAGAQWVRTANDSKAATAWRR